MLLRAMTDADTAAVLALNAASVDDLSPLDAERLAVLRSLAVGADVVQVDHEVAAFVLLFGPDAAYDSANFDWFRQRYGEQFLYLDRIAVGQPYRRRGIGALVYAAAERRATPYRRLVCEVNAEPPNDTSLAFHRARGFTEVGRREQGAGKVCAMFAKALAG
ncbi:MAG TPA: GNAT family N-acetyltransferase [Nocardioidaceae bacterium]|nr:GNAT family N-acetyltransferase [Nocardioidaceae bacterium]